MPSPLARWNVRQLVASWAGYWAVLAAATITPGVIALWKVSRAGAKGDASVSLGDGGLHATVTGTGVAPWDHTVSLTTCALLIAGPPLLLWVAWLFAASRQRGTAEADEAPQLASGAEIPFRSAERTKDEVRSR